jgi:hypothetical protein
MRINRLLLVVAITVLERSLQGDVLSLEVLRREVDSHGLGSGQCSPDSCLVALQMAAANDRVMLMVWLPIPHQELEPCIPIRLVKRQQARVWFSQVAFAPRPAMDD